MAHPDAESNSYPLAYCSVLCLLFLIKIAHQTSVGRNNDVTPQVLGCGGGIAAMESAPVGYCCHDYLATMVYCYHPTDCYQAHCFVKGILVLKIRYLPLEPFTN